MNFYKEFAEKYSVLTEDLSRAIDRDYKKVNEEISQINTINPNDDTAMKELREEYKESQKQEESKQENKNTLNRRRK